MAEIIKLWAKQAVNSALHHRNGFNTTLVYDLLFNSKVFVWHKNSNWIGFYCLLAVKDKMCYVQFLSGLTSFRNMFIKPYFWSKNICDIKPDKLKTFLPTLEIPCKFIEFVKF